ncbi:MAG TPA: acylphosphatase [Cyclobacteriaceae bacterium]|nr:acylphosphatase [Cyclobacteriaceae bacterium]
MKHVAIQVEGKVQGVFFRASTKDKADALGIKGFVRNEWDGSVYIEAEGEEDSLNQFISWCRQGPSRASVKEVIIREGPPKKFSGFEVQR